MGKMAKVIGYTFVGLVGLSVLTNMIPQEEADSKPKSTEVTKHVPEKKASRVSEDNYNKVVEGNMQGEGGMTIDEVKAIMGDPASVSQSTSGNIKMEILSWSSFKDGVTITISFTNGKVSSKSMSKF